MVEVEVAEYGPSAAAILDPNFFRGPLLEDQGDELAWSDRARTTVNVSTDASLASVLEMAAEEFGIALGPALARDASSVSSVLAGVAFHKPADDAPHVPPGPWQSTVRTLDDDGRLRWQSIEEARIEDLIRAYENGLLEGDPRRVYFWPMVSQGDAGLLFDTWEALCEGFRYALIAAGAIAAFGKTSEYLAKIIRRLTAGSEIDATRLDEMKVSPWRISELFSLRSFKTDEIQRLLGISGRDAVNAGEALGFEEQPDGEWSPGAGRDARFVHRLGEIFIRDTASRPHDWEAVNEFVRARLDALLRGEEEGPVVWTNEWYGKVSRFGLPDFAEEYDNPEGEPTREYRVLAIPIDGRINVARLEDELRAAAEEDFDIQATWIDQVLSDGVRANILILARTNRGDTRRKWWLPRWKTRRRARE